MTTTPPWASSPYLTGDNIPYETCWPYWDTTCRVAAPGVPLCKVTNFTVPIGLLAPFEDCCPNFSQHCIDGVNNFRASENIQICKYYVGLYEPYDGPGTGGINNNTPVLTKRWLTEEEFKSGVNPAYPVTEIIPENNNTTGNNTTTDPPVDNTNTNPPNNNTNPG